MIYKLGYMDKYPIEAAGSTVENNPMYRVTFKDQIDPEVLEKSIMKAFESNPLFKTSVKFKKEYYLETNDKPLVILKCNEENRPKSFGKSTNGYPFRITYFENKLCFEWLHGVSDGMGALKFLKEILMSYFDVDYEATSADLHLNLGLEPFYNPKESRNNFSLDPKGFSFKKFKKIKRGYKTDVHSLECNTFEIVNAAKENNSSVAPIIALLFAKAIREKLPLKMKNRNVACNVVMDLRRPLNYQTMHNCVEYKRITYVDEYEIKSFKEVAAIYKEKLDLARKKENIVVAINDRINLFKLLHRVGFTKKLLKKTVNLAGLLMKDSDCNFVVTYPGKIELPKKVMDNIDNIDFKVWHDFGECIISAVDYNGRFNVNISENFQTKGIVERFVELASLQGIHFEVKDNSIFEQSTFVE